MLSNGDIFLKFEGTLDLYKRNEDEIGATDQGKQ